MKYKQSEWMKGFTAAQKTYYDYLNHMNTDLFGNQRTVKLRDKEWVINVLKEDFDWVCGYGSENLEYRFGYQDFIDNKMLRIKEE